MHIPKNELISSIIYPPHDENNFWSYTVPLTNETPFTIRSLDIHTDLPVIHTWVNMPYAIPFWQMNISLGELEEACQSAMELPFAHTFVGCLYNQPYCQVDIYDPSSDTIGEYYPVEKGDLGMHLLIGPGKKPVRHFALQIVLPFLEFLFKSNLVNRIMAEPDERNRAANLLLEKLRFQQHGRLPMPHKTSNLYSMSKASFYQLLPELRLHL